MNYVGNFFTHSYFVYIWNVRSKWHIFQASETWTIKEEEI